MKQTIGDLWSRFTDRSNWKQEIGHWVLEIDGYVIATSSGIDDAEDPTCKWSIYRGKAEWASYCSEGVWSPVDYASESEARAAAWSTLVKIVAGPEWPHEPAEMSDDVFEFPPTRPRGKRARRRRNDLEPDHRGVGARRGVAIDAPQPDNGCCCCRSASARMHGCTTAGDLAWVERRRKRERSRYSNNPLRAT